MKRHMHYRLSWLQMLGILLLTACSSSKPMLPTEEVMRETPDVIATSNQDNEVAVVEVTSMPGDDLPEEREYRIITLLPKDAIRSIDDPQFYSVAEADGEYASDELVIGVEFDGEARAYSIALLSGHEIVNDKVGGRPIAITW